jgi:rhodanese-related sulfurtransferase
LSDACQHAGKALVSASVLGLSGYVGVFCGGGPSYRAVFPEMPQQAGTCAQTGVLGTAVGVIGTLQAQMVMSMVLQLQPAVLSQLISVDFRGMRFGGFRFATAQEPSATTGPRFISPAQLQATDVVVDVRSPEEVAAAPLVSPVRVTVAGLADVELALRRKQRVVICCRTGLRAWRAASPLQARGYGNIALIALG